MPSPPQTPCSPGCICLRGFGGADSRPPLSARSRCRDSRYRVPCPPRRVPAAAAALDPPFPLGLPAPQRGGSPSLSSPPAHPAPPRPPRREDRAAVTRDLLSQPGRPGPTTCPVPEVTDPLSPPARPGHRACAVAVHRERGTGLPRRRE